MRAVIAAAVLAAALGCGGASPQKRDEIPLTEVPENVMKVAKEKLPDVAFDKAWKTKDGMYEVSGKNKKGKIREIDVKPDGTVVDIE